MSASTPVPIAIVGLGKIARDQHLPAIAADGRFRLAAIVSGSGQTVDGLPTFPTLEALFAGAPEVAAVSLCTPPTGRFSYVETALRAGRHVMLEKPTAASLGEAEAIAELGRGSDRTLFATWHSRANPAVAEAARLLRGKALLRLAIDWREDVRRWHPGQAWIWQPGGFGVFDPGINALSIATAIAPSPLFVTAARLETAENHQTPIGATLRFATPGMAPGADLAAVFDWRKEGEQSWTIEVEAQGGPSLRLTEGGGRLALDGREVSLPPPAEYPALYDRFATLIAGQASDVDLRPLTLVADAFTLGERIAVPRFEG